MNTEEAQALVDSVKWYHSWEIVPGVITPGRCKVNPKEVLDYYGIAEDLTGLRALDIGAWDGAYSFELERRGATVVSLDVQDPDENAYNTASKILGSKCLHARCSAYDIDPYYGCIQDYGAGVGHFDLILYMGVFYHLEDPMRAWQAIKSVMKPETTLYFEGLVLDYAWNADIRLQHRKEDIEAIRDLPITYFSSEEFGYDPENWYIPTVTCLYSWLVAAGYEVINMGQVQGASRAYGAARVRG